MISGAGNYRRASNGISGSSKQAVTLMLLVYVKGARRINQDLEEKVNGAKPRKHASMERLLARGVIANDKGDCEEVEQNERSI